MILAERRVAADHDGADRLVAEHERDADHRCRHLLAPAVGDERPRVAVDARAAGHDAAGDPVAEPHLAADRARVQPADGAHADRALVTIAQRDGDERRVQRGTDGLEHGLEQDLGREPLERDVGDGLQGAQTLGLERAAF